MADLPGRVRGPVDDLALRRFASICFWVAMVLGYGGHGGWWGARWVKLLILWGGIIIFGCDGVAGLKVG